ncbi:MAG: hypothetical protein GC191_02490 [Azospirillum sp.]|nr:hypothetical protein [Azospirillum sp.]
MRIKIDIECAPEEARAFLGLPDVRPMQDALLLQVQNRMSETLHAMEPEAMFKAWLPMGIVGVEEIWKAFLKQMDVSGNKGKSA